MEKELEDVLTIDGEDYVVVDDIMYEGNKYTYVISSVNENKISILKETVENGETYIESVPKDKLEYFLNLFAKKFIEEKKLIKEVD